MHLLDLTLPAAAENLALDEAILDQAEALGPDWECLRLWESPEFAVVLGRSSQREVEANVAACEADGVPIVRRSSGGCAVVVGSGCLMYSVVLSYARQPHLHHIDEAHRFVLGHVGEALLELLDGVKFDGTSDLTWQGRKFSGNSLRAKRTHLLYHGTILYGFPLERIGRYLRRPPREPEYRAGRNHAEFLTNVPVEAVRLKSLLAEAFGATSPLAEWPTARIERLMLDRYGRSAWHADR
jgi:lipoate-protein ligase A